MLKYLILLLILAILVLLETSVMPALALWEARPDLILLFLVIWVMLRPTAHGEGLFLVLVGGLFLDFNSGWPFGVATVSLLVIFAVISRLAVDFLHGVSRLAIALVIMVATLVFGFLNTALAYFFSFLHLGHYSQDFGHWGTVLAPLILYNLVTGFIVYLISHYLINWLEAREKKVKLLQL